MSLRLVLTVLAALSAVVTALAGLSTVVDPYGTAARFGVVFDEDPAIRTVLLTLGAMIVSMALFTGLASSLVFRDRAAGRPLVLLCGASLLLVAALGGVVGGSTAILLLDGSRGTILAVLAALWRPGANAAG
jgi:hypothetical protein